MIRQFLIGLVAAPFILVIGVFSLIGLAVALAFLSIGELGEAIERRLWK